MKCKEVDQQGALIIYFSLHFRNFVSNCLSNPVSKDWATKNCRFWHAPIWPKYLSESPFRLSSNTSRSSAWARESSFAMLSPWLLIICRNSMIESLNILKDETYLFHLHWGWPTPGRYSYLYWSTITPILQNEIVTNGAVASFMSRWNIIHSFLKLWTWNLRLYMKGGSDELRHMSISSD